MYQILQIMFSNSMYNWNNIAFFLLTIIVLVLLLRQCCRGLTSNLKPQLFNWIKRFQNFNKRKPPIILTTPTNHGSLIITTLSTLDLKNDTTLTIFDNGRSPRQPPSITTLFTSDHQLSLLPSPIATHTCLSLML